MKKISFDSLSRITGFTPEYLSNLFHRSPWDWPPETRRKICRALNVPEEYLTASAR
ncbi:MAG: helix-turn-helix transcriptional regulator [Eubacteriales bacterium]|nr:helix-turn-helix transcriptional regulator [Eubacteriales bacterium]